MTAPAVHSLHMLVHLLLLVPRCLPACPAGLHVDVLHSLLLILLLPPLPALQTCMIRYTMGGRVGGQVNLELPRLTEELKLASPSSCCLLWLPAVRRLGMGLLDGSLLLAAGCWVLLSAAGVLDCSWSICWLGTCLFLQPAAAPTRPSSSHQDITPGLTDCIASSQHVCPPLVAGGAAQGGNEAVWSAGGGGGYALQHTAPQAAGQNPQAGQRAPRVSAHLDCAALQC